MAEKLVIPHWIELVDGQPTATFKDKISRDKLLTMVRQGVKLKNGWFLKPKRWKHGGSTFYGFALEKKL